MSAAPVRSIGVIRPHVPAWTPGPRRHLTRALDRALESLAERLRRFRPGSADEDEAVDFFWNRPAPRLLVRQDQVRQEWHFSPTVLVNLSRPLAISPPDMTAAEPSKTSRIALPAPVLMRTLERRLETRVLDRTLSVLRETTGRRPPEQPARTSETSAVPPPQHLVVRTDAPVVRTEMVFARTPAAPAAAEPGTSAAAAQNAAQVRQSPPPSPPQAPPLRLERITAEVIRALDARGIARRERMGRS